MQSAIVTPRTSRTYLSSTVMAHAAFVPTGMVTVMLGPLLPLLAARWSLNDTQSGYLISAQFFGALVGTMSSSFFQPRIGFRKSMSAGAIFMAVGVEILISGGFAVAAIAAFCNGIGLGLTIPAGNLSVAAVNPERRSSSLNLLNFSWSAGAVSCPFLLAYLQRVRGTELFLHFVAGFLIVISCVLLVTKCETPAPIPDCAVAPAPRARDLWSPAAILLGTLFFIYVGTENALGVWLASYAKRMTESSTGLWMLVSSYFYGAILVGRALAPFTVRYLNDARQACYGAILALLSSIAVVLSRSMMAVAVCAFLAGLGLSTLYPITIGVLSLKFGERAKGVGGFLFGLSTLGGASLPWLVGFVSTELRSLRAGLMVPLAGCLLMAAVFSSSRWMLTPTRRSLSQVACD